MQKPEFHGIMKNKLKAALALAISGMLFSCGGGGEQTPAETPKTEAVKREPANVPAFSSDSAYAYTAAQVAFGPRVPNTAPHVKCGDYLIAMLKRFGAEVIVQPASVTAHTGETLKIRNIVGRLHPTKTRRLMICCHWDTRPFSDRDPEKP